MALIPVSLDHVFVVVAKGKGLTSLGYRLLGATELIVDLTSVYIDLTYGVLEKPSLEALDPVPSRDCDGDELLIVVDYL